MKVAITSDGEGLHSKVDQRFGRCKYFLIVDVYNNEIKNTEVIENQGAIQGHGAGIKAAQQVGELKVNAVITGNLGPNSTNVLKQLGIKTYHASGVAKEAVLKLIKNELDEITEVAEAHNDLGKKEQVEHVENKNNNEEDSKIVNEKIFFPLLDNNGLDSKISEHFGHAPFFGLYDMEKKELNIIPNDLDHTNPNKSPIDQIEEAVNPTTIFAKGIGGRAIGIIQQKGLGLKTGDYNTVKDALDNFDKLTTKVESCGHEH